ncbi:nucleotide exchange factor GrpE [Methanoplanus endosymbiosus]|uniref:Protein GrpE n=1 Tax=Methanoplanus endosymbiosus TaxID=33865 RepID=A0A9E7PR70_9EURY|nr:nucleotide exchange factor GrpE [Methanoplanus endosymbiosus]UUX93521.1 nucleotide exchange factor GrpE [Methanoplanus endosymbiosus]
MMNKDNSEEKISEENVRDNPDTGPGSGPEIPGDNPPEDGSGTSAGTDECKEISAEERLIAENAELKGKYLRLAADFENYRKRSLKEISDRSKRAVESFSIEILEVSDNIDRALKSDDDSRLREGLEQIQKILEKVLKSHSITPMESVDKQFDPNKHEAIAYVPSDSEEGIIIDEIVCGYCMDDKVIRCAKVAVSKGKEE